MREALDQWDYVIFAYAVGLVALAWLIAWSWRSMIQAEKRRGQSRRQKGER